MKHITTFMLISTCALNYLGSAEAFFDLFGRGKKEEEPQCECREYQANVCEYRTEQQCQTINDRVCETKYRDDCSETVSQQCETTYTEVCTEKEQQPTYDCQEPISVPVTTTGDTYTPTFSASVAETYGAPQADVITSVNKDYSPVNSIQLTNSQEVVTAPQQDNGEDNQSRAFGLFGTINNLISPSTQSNKQPCKTSTTHHSSGSTSYGAPVAPTIQKECNKVPVRTCKDVPKRHCQNVAYSDCKNVPKQNCQSINVPVSRPVVHQECAVPQRGVVIEFKEEEREDCREVPQQVCEVVHENRCKEQAQVQTHPRQVCQTDYQQLCPRFGGFGQGQCKWVEEMECTLPTYDTPKTCRRVKKQDCGSGCQTVPIEKCQTVYDTPPQRQQPVCEKQTHQVCTNVPVVECAQTKVQVPCEVEKVECVWPKNRHHDQQC